MPSPDVAELPERGGIQVAVPPRAGQLAVAVQRSAGPGAVAVRPCEAPDSAPWPVAAAWPEDEMPAQRDAPSQVVPPVGPSQAALPVGQPLPAAHPGHDGPGRTHRRSP
ncbi:hypothetical protein J4G43_016360 [Bradyrhizobium barranii subsp. barranii]|uniref:Uncharacterized protein n=1 Tax=Bradyrhizobium barranii subsp. barranii TaxID=2823807 RepID=A0A9X9Y6U1_9BRAD|nr:hypothetical protein [Bradyrhizobium barranii]UEM15635.1 hypothetical protein J4G43_016360 [Bradyrhizobium barranii subsp. barranii]